MLINWQKSNLIHAVKRGKRLTERLKEKGLLSLQFCMKFIRNIWCGTLKVVNVTTGIHMPWF